MSFELIIPFLRPIESLLADHTVEEIMCNLDAKCWVERGGIVKSANHIRFKDGEPGLEVIANKFGKQLDADHPILTVRLPDGSRLSAMIPPVVGPGPLVNIRKFVCRNFTLDDLAMMGTLQPEMAQTLLEAVRERRNVLISGRYGNGQDYAAECPRR